MWHRAVMAAAIICPAQIALLKDFAQWALVSTSVLYLAWLRLTAPTGANS
jgi:hypothetical protein